MTGHAVSLIPCTGVGGGYMERDNVEYIQRDESDDEFDEVITQGPGRTAVALCMQRN